MRQLSSQVSRDRREPLLFGWDTRKETALPCGHRSDYTPRAPCRATLFLPPRMRPRVVSWR